MALSIAETIRKKVGGLVPGSVFDYTALNIAPEEMVTAAQSLSRLARAGIIKRLERGKYYKPQPSKFGNTRPEESAIVNALTLKNNRRTGYLTGLSVYNQLGLTSQLSSTLVIASPNPLPPKNIQGYKIKYVLGKLDFAEKDIPLLQLLDAVRDIKTIPDSSPDESLKVLTSRIKNLSLSEKRKLLKLSLSYNAGARALLGAMMEQYFPEVSITRLKQSINRLSSFDIDISIDVLPTKRAWRIV